MKRIPLGPVCLDLSDPRSRAAAVEARIRDGAPGQIVTLNALMFHCALRDESLAAAVRAAALVVPDSAGIVWAARCLKEVTAERCSGIDFIGELCRLSVVNGWRMFFLGAGPGTAQRAADALAAAYPGLAVAGAMHGYFKPGEEAGVIRRIREARPDIVLVALAVPRQDRWIADNLSALAAPLVMGVGGSFDVICGDLRRAPRWMQNSGLEWLYRTLRQPWRLARIKYLPVFVADVLRLKYRDRRQASGDSL